MVIVSINRQIIDIVPIVDWRRVQKVKPVHVKHMSAILADQSIATKILLSTIEGSQILKAGSMVCRGVCDDYWQQAPDRFLKQYSVTDITPDGWLVGTPKPESWRWSTQITDLQGADEFAICGVWGDEQVVDGKQVFLQYGVAGDYICKSAENASDVWVVARKIFESTMDYVEVQ